MSGKLLLLPNPLSQASTEEGWGTGLLVGPHIWHRPDMSFLGGLGGPDSVSELDTNSFPLQLGRC